MKHLKVILKTRPVINKYRIFGIRLFPFLKYERHSKKEKAKNVNSKTNC
jgi:hypothetical protein